MIRTGWMLAGLVAMVVTMGMAGAAAANCGHCGPGDQGKAEAKAKVELPEAVAKTIKDNYPNATIEEAKMVEGAKTPLYKVELEEEGKAEVELKITGDGTILCVETEIAMKDAPEAVAKAIEKAAEGATVKEVEKEEVRAEVTDKGEIVKLEKSKMTYEAELTKGDQEGEITVAEDGTILKPLKWEKKEAEEKGEHEKGEAKCK